MCPHGAMFQFERLVRLHAHHTAATPITQRMKLVKAFDSNFLQINHDMNTT